MRPIKCSRLVHLEESRGALYDAVNQFLLPPN
jgi:hypothetical protein